MGWWKVENEECYIGDSPLDALGDVVQSIVDMYVEMFSRAPTRAEWITLLNLVFQGRETPLTSDAVDVHIVVEALDSPSTAK